MLLEPGSRDVVVVAGLPGAGKTTLVAREPRALDSDAVRERWAPRLRGLPYALWRPFAHLWHWVALWRALGRRDGVVVVRPFTSSRRRRAVLRRARRHHPAVHLVVVEATPEQARAGQLVRGRRVGERAMRRHERRWADAELEREGWTTVLRLARHEPQAPLSLRVAPLRSAASHSMITCRLQQVNGDGSTEVLDISQEEVGDDDSERGTLTLSCSGSSSPPPVSRPLSWHCKLRLAVPDCTSANPSTMASPVRAGLHAVRPSGSNSTLQPSFCHADAVRRHAWLGHVVHGNSAPRRAVAALDERLTRHVTARTIRS